MLRLLISSFSAVLFAVGTAQDWQPQGKIDSRDIQIERREGNVIKGTEFVHFEYRVSLQVVPTDQISGNTYVDCNAKCKGKKHKAHAECDQSCDERCAEKHPVKLQGFVNKLRSEMDQMTKTSAAKAKAIGMPGGPNNWSSATSNALKAIEAAAKADKVEMDAEHLNVPCTYTTRFYGYNVHDVRIKGEFWKVGYYQTGGVRTPINEKVDSQEGTVMKVYKTSREPLDKGESVFCFCSTEAPEPPKPIGVIPGNKPRTTRTPTFSGLGWRKPDGTVVIPDDKKITVTCTGKSLQVAELVVDNKTGEAYEVIIYSGTKLVPGDAGTQIMTCVGSQTATVAAASTTTLWVSLQPEPRNLLPAPFELNVACTQINKRQPSSNTTFKITPPDDPTLERICEIEDRGFMQGAVAQGRVWIYTDLATREQINKHLLPGLTDGMYLNALYGMHRAGVDLALPRYRPVLDPTLLAAPTASKEATFWYADFLARQDPKMAYAKRVVDAVKSGLSSKAEALDARHAAHVAQALSESDSKEIRMMVLDLMDKSIPVAHKAEFLREGGFAAMLSIGTFGDDAEALQVFEVAKKFPGPQTKAMLESFAFFGRESIRTAAEEAAKGM